jgi:hypothetical protein
MPTIIGVIFFCCGAYCFVLRQDGLLGLLVIASIFQAASAINIGERGIQPYYVVAAFLIARAMVNWVLGRRSRVRMPRSGWLALFGAIAIASAFILPVVFAGIPVYDPKIGIDEGLLVQPPLAFGLNNIAQAAFLVCQIATAYAVLAIGFTSNKTRRMYLWAFYLVVLIVAAQSVCQLTGVPFPKSLILNNPGYSLWDLGGGVGGTRNPGTFSEPSFAGGFLAMCCVGFLAQYLAGKGGALHLIISLVASGLVASAGSLLTISFFALALLVRYFPFRPPWHINVGRTKRLIWLALLVAAPLAFALLSSGYRDALMTNTVSKGDSLSFINRTASDLFALQLLIRSHGMGVGLGSNRASSLLTTLLSNVGIAGTLAFGVFYFKMFAGLSKEYAWLKWAAFALVVNMCINIPDLTIPILWLPIMLAIQFSSGEKPVRRQLRGVDPAFGALRTNRLESRITL